MDYQPRTIAFLCELFHPAQPVEARSIQKLHNEMFESGRPSYSSFAVTPAGPLLSNPATRPGAASQVAFLPDRFQFREELGGVTEEQFGRRVREVVERVADLRAMSQLGGQQVTIRSLINPRTFRDAREFLKEGMFGFDQQMECLGREPRLYGLRLVFPPEKGLDNAFALRIESYNSDPRSIYLEVQSTFGPIQLGEHPELVEERVLETYGFLIDRALPFVARFDVRQQA